MVKSGCLGDQWGDCEAVLSSSTRSSGFIILSYRECIKVKSTNPILGVYKSSPVGGTTITVWLSQTLPALQGVTWCRRKSQVRIELVKEKYFWSILGDKTKSGFHSATRSCPMTSRTRTVHVYLTEHGSFLRRRFKEVWRTQHHLRGTGQSYACPRKASKVGRYRYCKTGAIFSTLSFKDNTNRFPSVSTLTASLLPLLSCPPHPC